MARSLRVLHIGKFFPPHVGGMETYLGDLVHAQRAMGIDVAVLVHGTPRADDPPWLTRVPVQAQVVYAPLAIGLPQALHRLLLRLRPEVLHLHMPNNAVFWALLAPAAARVPWVVQWHSDVVPSRIRGALAWAYRLYRPFEWAVLERAERIAATSPPYLAHSEALAPWRGKSLALPLALRLPPPSSTDDRTAPQDPLPWSPGTLRLLAIGRLAYYKGFEVLIRAVARTPGVELALAGGGELWPSLVKLARELFPPGAPQRVHLLGSVSEARKARLLEACDVFCLPSRERTEAFGMVLLEAMARAKPCAVSALPGSGMPWLVQQSGGGVTVPVDDVDAWAAALVALQRDPSSRERMGRAGAAAVRTRFEIGANARQWQRVYGQMLGQRRHRARGGLLVVIPARDEATTVGRVVAAVLAMGLGDVLVIDDHSSDGTGALARAAGARVVRPVLPVGAWGGMQTGLRYAARHGYAGVVTMDADGQHEPGQIPQLLAHAGTADIVVGAFPERASRLRHLAWHWFRQLAGFDLRDLTSGFRHYNRPAMALMASPDAALLDYQDLGALLLATGAGLRIREVPVAMQARTAGHSRIFRSWFGVARYMALTTLLCITQRWNRQRPTTLPGR